TEGRPVELAVRVFAPAVVLSVHEPTAAMPLAFVVALPPLLNEIATPETGVPYWSVTSTDGAVETFVPTVAVWPSPALTDSEPAASCTAVAWNVAEPTEAVAVRLFAPALVPSVHEPTVATPVRSVVCERPVAEPPPEATLNVTATPETGLPY